MLGEALESLARQTYDDFETVIVLDECWEDTRSVVSPWEDILNPCLVFETPRKRGLAYAKNFGIEKCSGDWIAYLDADDLWMDCKMEVQRDFMIASKQLDLCFTEYWDRDPETNVWTPNCFDVGQYGTHLEIARRLPNENVLGHGSAVIRKSLLEDLGGYCTDSRVLGWEDYDLWQRAMESGAIFGKVPERLYVYTLGTSVER
jgi:glycosyltransferase involved in cell wall biosynthesis